MDEWVAELFRDVDRMDPGRFVDHLTEDATFKFGNAQPAVGRGAIRKAVADFFGTIKGLRHRIVDMWHVGDSVLTEIEVTYERRDGKKVVIPGMNLFKMRGDKIREYKIFIDIAPLYA